MLLGRSSPVSPRGQPGQVLQGPGRSLLGQLLHPGGEQFPSFGHRSGLCQRVLASPQTPLHPGEQRRSRTRSAPSWGPQARPSARKDEAVPRAPLPPPSCTPPPAGPQPCSLTRQRPATCPPAVASLRGLHTPGPGRPVLLTRFAPWRGRTLRWSSRRKVSSEERGGTGRGGAGRRGGRKSAWRKGRGGGPGSPTGSRWGGRSQGPPQLVLTTTSLTKHP